VPADRLWSTGAHSSAWDSLKAIYKNKNKNKNISLSHQAIHKALRLWCDDKIPQSVDGLGD
jgi:hypothetical protein